jgi:hypothetical protein
VADGRLHRIDAWNWLEDELLQFGGASRETAAIEGWYFDPDTGEQVRDRSRRYVVAVARNQVSRLRVLLRQACAVFRQKCIYLSVAGDVEFVEGIHETDN